MLSNRSSFASPTLLVAAVPPVRLAQALERMEAAAESLVDADDQAHLAAVR